MFFGNRNRKNPQNLIVNIEEIGAETEEEAWNRFFNFGKYRNDLPETDYEKELRHNGKVSGSYSTVFVKILPEEFSDKEDFIHTSII